jgi:hypothetical protein
MFAEVDVAKAVHESLGNHRHLDVRMLRGPHQSVKGRVGVDPEDAHDHALGLVDGGG